MVQICLVYFQRKFYINVPITNPITPPIILFLFFTCIFPAHIPRTCAPDKRIRSDLSPGGIPVFPTLLIGPRPILNLRYQEWKQHGAKYEYSHS